MQPATDVRQTDGTQHARRSRDSRHATAFDSCGPRRSGWAGQSRRRYARVLQGTPGYCRVLQGTAGVLQADLDGQGGWVNPDVRKVARRKPERAQHNRVDGSNRTILKPTNGRWPLLEATESRPAARGIGTAGCEVSTLDSRQIGATVGNSVRTAVRRGASRRIVCA